eukprot:1192662-Prorocentrum_minimum.AAC.3
MHARVSTGLSGGVEGRTLGAACRMSCKMPFASAWALNDKCATCTFANPPPRRVVWSGGFRLRGGETRLRG